MAKNKNTVFNRKFRYDPAETSYQFQVAPRHNRWWLWLLLLLPLLLVRCGRDIDVLVVDTEKNQPVTGMEVQLDYTCHALYRHGSIFDSRPEHFSEATGPDGIARFRNLPCSVFSYIFYCLSSVTATVDGQTQSKLFHFADRFTFYVGVVNCSLDVVMCIDTTGSMTDVLDMVKENARSFANDLARACLKNKRNVRSLRVKVIPFGDFIDGPALQSPEFSLPDQETEFMSYVSDINLTNGGDSPENGLEAVVSAMKDTRWSASDDRMRHVIVVYTDAEPHPFGFVPSEYDYFGNPADYRKNYPGGMPADMAGMKAAWDGMDKASRRMVLFAPEEGLWNDVAGWPDVRVESGNLSRVLSGDGYEDVLNAISKSL